MSATVTVDLPSLSQPEYELLVYALGLAQGVTTKEQMFDTLEALVRLSDKIMAGKFLHYVAVGESPLKGKRR